MSSIMLHICIAKEVMRLFDFSYSYMKGSVMPDILKLNGVSRNTTHYITEYVDGVREVPNLEKYKQEHKENFSCEEVLGYYSHLKEDQIWFQHYVSRYVKVHEEDNKIVDFIKKQQVGTFDEYCSKMYQDFYRLNNFLIDTYHLKVDEIKQALLKDEKDEALQKLITENISVNENMKTTSAFFFDEKEAQRYISECVATVKDDIKNISK